MRFGLRNNPIIAAKSVLYKKRMQNFRTVSQAFLSKSHFSAAARSAAQSSSVQNTQQTAAAESQTENTSIGDTTTQSTSETGASGISSAAITSSAQSSASTSSSSYVDLTSKTEQQMDQMVSEGTITQAQENKELARRQAEKESAGQTQSAAYQQGISAYQAQQTTKYSMETEDASLDIVA